MLDVDTRTAVLRLQREGHGLRPIAKSLGISRNAVRRILVSGAAEVPKIERQERLEPHLDRIRDLNISCEGNLVRVQEELDAAGVGVAYSTLTGFCRRHGIGVQEKRPAGRYHFEPGEEMQHDTSPHRVKIGGVERLVQCGSLVLCHSRMIYAQVYPTFNRFWCNVFLTDALLYLRGAASRCMLDNSSIVIAHGTGKNAVPAPEMATFAERFDFHFAAHELGDANRSARVERPFHYIENNFYKGRTFADVADLNRQLVIWCDKVNGRFKRKLRAIPAALYQVERATLKRLPLHVPEVYALWQRMVDLEGYVSLHANRYSVPPALIGQRVDIRESKDRVRIFLGHKEVGAHARLEDRADGRATLPEHRDPSRWRLKAGHDREPPIPEESTLRSAAPELATMVDALRRKHGGRAVRPVRRLHRLFVDYPTPALVEAVVLALQYGLTDMERLERIVLRHLSGDFFRVPALPLDTEDSDD